MRGVKKEQGKQLFLSHTWQPDELGRDTHSRVASLRDVLCRHGWTCWFDEDDMGIHLDGSMVSGIDNARVVLVCLTQKYCDRIGDATSDMSTRSNCLKEWTYAQARCKPMLAVIMEPCMLMGTKWPAGIVTMQFGTSFYIDLSLDCNMERAVRSLTALLASVGICPRAPLLRNSRRTLKRPPRVLCPAPSKDSRNQTVKEGGEIPSTCRYTIWT